jgi:hypothetical protein
MDFNSITSQELLDRISRHCPSSLSTYLQCINRCDSEGTVVFSKDLVENDMSETFLTFKNRIKKLALENLLEWHFTADGSISVTLAPQEEECQNDL